MIPEQTLGYNHLFKRTKLKESGEDTWHKLTMAWARESTRLLLYGDSCVNIRSPRPYITGEELLDLAYIR